MTSTNATAETPAEHVAPFTRGSIPRHLVFNTLMGAIGLMALFLVDFADLWFVSRLHDVDATAGLGLAGAVGFFHLSLALGLAIAAGARVAIHTGQRDVERARSIAATALGIGMGMGVAFLLLVWAGAELILAMMGGHGRTQELGATYLRIIGTGFPLQAGTLVFSLALRGYGMPVKSMTLTLTSAIVNAVLDPIFIFGLDMGLAGAGLATLTAFVASFVMGLFQLRHHYTRLFGPAGRAWSRIFRPNDRRADVKALLPMAIPITLAHLATPVMTGYMLAIAARFGPDIAAAMTVVNRVAVVAFGVTFSLSGAVGPIIGQNFGARLMKRVRHAYEAGLLFAAGYTLAGWLVLALLAGRLPGAFGLSGQAAAFVRLFSEVTAGAWVFTGMQFVAQAAFNNLENSRLSMLYNWGRAILGTIVPVEIAIRVDDLGAFGILWGTAIGWAVIGLLAVLHAWSIIRRLERQ
jgi:putative MATE family efflux protein